MVEAITVPPKTDCSIYVQHACSSFYALDHAAGFIVIVIVIIVTKNYWRDKMAECGEIIYDLGMNGRCKRAGRHPI